MRYLFKFLPVDVRWVLRSGLQQNEELVAKHHSEFTRFLRLKLAKRIAPDEFAHSARGLGTAGVERYAAPGGHAVDPGRLFRRGLG